MNPPAPATPKWRCNMAKRKPGRAPNLRTLKERFWERGVKNGPVPEYRPDLGPCWIWVASTTSGYGRIHETDRRSRNLVAHKVAYEWASGPVPDGLTLDHLCRVRSCVNPAHLEPVTRTENVMRGEGDPARNA